MKYSEVKVIVKKVHCQFSDDYKVFKSKHPKIFKKICHERIHSKINLLFMKSEINNPHEKLRFRMKCARTSISYIPRKAVETIIKWRTLNKSPWSQSFYDTKDISWGHKPEGSVRVSDHWNFETPDGELHCKTKCSHQNGWAIGQYENGSYKILNKF